MVEPDRAGRGGKGYRWIDRNALAGGGKGEKNAGVKNNKRDAT